MKKFCLFSVLFFAASVVAFFFIAPKSLFIQTVTADTATPNLASPLPSLLTQQVYAVGNNTGFWKPDFDPQQKDLTGSLALTAVSALSYDLTTNKLLYAKQIQKHMPIASLTKIMTAVVALENDSPDDLITINSQAANIGEDSMGLTAGEKLTVHELLYGLFLHSGNDAAEAIAGGSKFGRDYFIYQMNRKAEDLGLSNTHFTNPTGLQGDGNQYSTAYDLLVMTRYGLQNPVFAETSSTIEKDLPANQYHKHFYLENETNLMTTYPGVKGVKTGFTDEAGMCLVTYLDYQGHHIIAVILNSEDRRQEMKDLLDYSLKSEGITPPKHE